VVDLATMSRPTVLTDELQELIAERVEVTGDVIGSAVQFGCSVQSVYRWMKQGSGDGPEWSQRFFQRMQEARAIHRNKLLEKEIGTRVEIKKKIVKLPDNRTLTTVEEKKVEADSATIDRVLKREYPSIYPAATPRSVQVNVLNIDRQFEAINASPWQDPREFPLEETTALPAEIVVDRRQQIIDAFMHEGQDAGS